MVSMVVEEVAGESEAVSENGSCQEMREVLAKAGWCGGAIRSIEARDIEGRRMKESWSI